MAPTEQGGDRPAQLREIHRLHEIGGDAVEVGEGLGGGHGQADSPLAVPTAVFWPCWFSHQTSTTTRVAPRSGRSSLTTPRTVRRSPAYTGCTKATDIVPPLMKPAPSRRVIISETYAVDIIPCASVVRKPRLRAHASSL